MADEKDLEIARLKGQLEGMQAAKSAGGGGALKVILILAGIAVVGFLGMVAFGASLPEGWRFEAECERAAGGGLDAKACMRDLEAIYRGPDDARYRQNAADQWARDQRPAE